MGKGTMTVNPYTTNRQLVSRPAISALYILLTSFSDHSLILGKAHYFFYYLVPCMHPRHLMTVDDQGHQIATTVRVGQAVDVVGQAGRPKTITGFQTHTTPVLLGYTERAELATEEYLPVSDVLEGFVILKKNPEVY